jgi:hypothetical protein
LCFILKIDRMLYGFYFFTSCPARSALLKLMRFSNGSRQNSKCYGMVALRRFWDAAEPGEMVSLIRVAAISSGDRGAAVPRRLRPRWKSG